MNRDAKKILKISLVSLLFLTIVILIFVNSRELLFGIKIKNLNVQDNMLISENTLKITGVAKNAVETTLNGRRIFIDQDGNFSETISLFSGYNVVEIYAKDKFGNEDKKIYKLMH